MRQVVAVVLGLGIIALTTPGVARAADPCPAELAQAKAALKSAQAKSQDIQSPRSQAGARSQDIQAPRQQDIQAPRQQDIQAPRQQDIQAPRQQDIQAPRQQDIQAPRSQQEPPVPRGQDIQAPRVKQAGALVQQADAACKKGDMTLSARKAREALGLLKK
ncbi:MAG: hypothetical protein ACHQ8D_03395 [Candidatus Rokuibacteriota bacterium]